MKKVVVLVATCATFFGAVFVAQAANEYKITTSTSPTKSGTKKKPVPISGVFQFNVTSTTPGRPAALDALKVLFTGIRINTGNFPGCSAASIEQAQSDEGCKNSLVASGYARNVAGNVNDRSDASIRCYLTVRLHNSGRGRMALFVSGGPNGTPEPCPIAVATAIPVSVTRLGTGDQLSFSIPDNLKEPVRGSIRNALVETRLSYTRKTRRIRGRTVGMFETVGGCRRGRRTVNVTFDNEGTSDDRTQSGSGRCTS